MVCVIKLEARKCPRGTSLEPARTKPFSNTVRAGALEGLCASGLAQNRLWSHPSLGAHSGCRVRLSRHEQSPSRAPARKGLCASGLERSPSRAPAPIVYEMGFARAGSHGSHCIACRPKICSALAMPSLNERARANRSSVSGWFQAHVPQMPHLSREMQFLTELNTTRVEHCAY